MNGYELGQPQPLQVGTMYPTYVQAQAYLLMPQGKEAAGEFQKIIDHRGIVVNFPLGALAHLGLARACALQADIAKSRAAYQAFLTLWKYADPDIPILKQAKAEYSKLQSSLANLCTMNYAPRFAYSLTCLGAGSTRPSHRLVS